MREEPEGVIRVSGNETLEYLRKRFGITSERQLDEAIRKMNRIDIGIFAGKDGWRGASNQGSTGTRRATDRTEAVR